MAKHSGYDIRISRAARRDMVAVMRWSVQEFGADAAKRYDALLSRALADIGEDPERAGSQHRDELPNGVLVYHLRFSRDRARSVLGVVHQPRHFLVYRRRDHVIDVLRVLHDARDLKRHLPK